MKKKNVIICTISAVILAGASVVLAYTFDGGSSSTDERLEAKEGTETVIKEVVLKGGSTGEERIHRRVLTKEQAEAEAKAEAEWEKTKDILVRVTAENEFYGKEYAASLKEAQYFRDDMIRDCYGMNEAQIKEYVERTAKGGQRVGIGKCYERICDEILGKMSADTPRLTAETIDELVNESDSAVELYNNIQSRYGRPDLAHEFSGRSGGVYEYWLDDEGTEWLEVIMVPIGGHGGKVESIRLMNYDDRFGPGKILYSNDDLKALYGEE